MPFIEDMKLKAKSNMKKIVLPESEDKRVLEATDKIIKEGFAKVILIGNKERIENIAKENNLNIIGAEIFDPEDFENFDKYANDLYELRKAKGMTLEQATELLKTNNTYFATMMVKEGDADGYVSGAAHSTSDTLRPALQILKTAPGAKLVSSFFVMVLPDKEFGEDGIMIFSDCGLNENPDSEALSEIAIASANSFNNLVGAEAKVAMLSYSTHGSAHSELTEKVIEATKLVKEKAPELVCDGELQLDAAIIPTVAGSKAPDSPLKGKANVLVFPDLNAGNIGYKLTQRLAHAEAYGPLCQGVARPVNDLSRGCSSEDIVGVVAITAVQAQNM